MWTKVDRVSLTLPVTEAPAPVKPPAKKGAKTTAKAAPVTRKPAKPVEKPFDGTVFAFTRDGDRMFAATSDGVLKSTDSGQSWVLAANPEGHVWYSISSAKSVIFASSLSRTSLSTDGGQTWAQVTPPSDEKQITAVAVDGFGGLWVGGRDGIYLSEDKGATWQIVKNLYVRDVNSIFYDERGQRVLVTANSSTTLVFAAHLPDKKVNYWNTGWNMRLVRPVGNHLVGATLFDGIVIQPEMVNSAEVTKH